MKPQQVVSNSFLKTALAVLFTLILVLLACTKPNEQISPSGPQITYKIAIVSGNNQSGPIGQALSAPLTVYVSDENNLKKANVTVLFSVTGGYGELSPTTAVSDAEGMAQSTLTPTYAAGEVKVQAKVYGTSTSVTFTATGTQ